MDKQTNKQTNKPESMVAQIQGCRRPVGLEGP